MVAFQTKDVDLDFQADRRPEIKKYLEDRYNKAGMQRVFSAGTFTTIKIKTAIKDICRVHRVSVGTANYITAIVEKDSMTWTDFMRLAATDKRVRDFVEQNPDVFEEIVPLMEQTRSAGIHASAVIVTPEYVKGKKVDCFDLLPIRKMDNMLVSELSGYDADALGILKNDVLAIQELTRLSDMLELIRQQYKTNYTTLNIVVNHANDPKVLETISSGNTQGIFQMSGDGITRFIRRMKPEDIKDIIALVALFRPGPLDTGAASAYCDVKNLGIEPEYLWGTYDILKPTYGQIVYQEQIAELARKIGGLSLGDGVNLVKAISKKKIEKVNKFKDKFFKGAEENGCPKKAAEEIWNSAEKFASYAFNQSHATAYGLTSYVGAWIKTYYPMPFYTVILRDVKDEKLPAVINEIDQFGNVELCQPDINISGRNFVPDYDNKKIYWSLARIKWVGLAAVDSIVKERLSYGDFIDMEEFIRRMFRGRLGKKSKKETNDTNDKSPINVRVVRMLIYAGAFDKCEHVKSVCDRYELLKKAMDILGETINEKETPPALVDKHYFWSQIQIDYSGFGHIDYQKIWKSFNVNSNYKWLDFNDLNGSPIEKDTRITGAMIIEVHDRTYKSKRDGSTKHYGKITLLQNYQTTKLTLWNDSWSESKDLFVGREHDIMVATVMVKWSEYDERNVLQINKGAFLETIRTKE